MSTLTCTRCNKHLSRKTARQIGGEVICSACLFAPLKWQSTEEILAKPKRHIRIVGCRFIGNAIS